jgi:predicted porin
MKKSLIALAVLAASGAAMAQSSVTLYGLLDLHAGRTSSTNNVGAKINTTVLNSGSLNTSRWGLRGSEDLGGGLKAVFKLEASIAADVGTSTGFSRQSYLGLEGGFGSLTFGKTWTAMDDVIGAANSGFDSNIYSSSNGVLKVQELYAGNPGNTIKYTSPSFGGLSGGFSYSLDESPSKKTDVTDFSLSYGAGPVAANFAYQTQGDQAGSEDRKLTVLNGSYDLGVAKLLASYGQVKLANDKSTDFQFGADVPLSSALILSAGYSQSKDESSGVDGAKRTGFGLAAAYSLSKRTTAHAGFRQAKVKNTSVKDSLFAVGIRHTF